jgi:hypothetical protein
MSDFWVEDLDAMFNAGTPGCYEAMWNGLPIMCLFDSPFIQGELGVENAAPVAWVKDSDVMYIIQGQEITINEVAYIIRGIEPDGTGVTKLTLSLD